MGAVIFHIRVYAEKGLQYVHFYPFISICFWRIGPVFKPAL